MRGNPIELAWAAGFFDGEGSTSYRPARELTRPGRVVMSLGQREITTLERFIKAVDYGKVNGPYSAGTKGQKDPKPRYRWGCQNTRSTRAVLTKLWPYLSEPKKEQAREAFLKIGEEFDA